MAKKKERALELNSHMVRSILNGTKSVMRLPITASAMATIERAIQAGECIGPDSEGNYHPNDLQFIADLCALGQPGQRLYVKEATIAQYENCGSVTLSCYEEDKSPLLYSSCQDSQLNGTQAHWDYPRWRRPASRLPRWASRLFLEITSVRVERLQSISDDQCIAEGIRPIPRTEWEVRTGVQFWLDYTLGGSGGSCVRTPRESFQSLWKHNRGIKSGRDSGPHSWDENPWVWVIGISRIEAPR